MARSGPAKKSVSAKDPLRMEIARRHKAGQQNIGFGQGSSGGAVWPPPQASLRGESARTGILRRGHLLLEAGFTIVSVPSVLVGVGVGSTMCLTGNVFTVSDINLSCALSSSARPTRAHVFWIWVALAEVQRPSFRKVFCRFEAC